MFVELMSKITGINDFLFGFIDEFIEHLTIADFAKDAICDSIHLVPFLFIIFVLIEWIETYYTYRMKNISEFSYKYGPLLGAVAAGLPQCGFSVIATPLYIKKVISRGTLIAIYISTSDEAIPILLAHPEFFKDILPILAIKICIGVVAGYLVDFIRPQKDFIKYQDLKDEDKVHDEGCCSHHIKPRNIWEFLIHPAKHTVNIFLVILIISLLLNYCFDTFGNDLVSKVMLNKSALQPILASFIGIIPNCAVSVLITMLYITGVMSFASTISGLSSGAGLGLIVLFKRNNNLKDSFKIVGFLILISIIAGFLVSLF